MSQTPSLYQTHFPPTEFAARRENVFAQIEKDAVVLLAGASAQSDLELFRQSNDFYYMCGVEVPDAYLLLDGSNRETTLYLPSHNPAKERSEGPILNADDPELAQTLTGVESVRNVSNLLDDLVGRTIIYVLHDHETSPPERPLALPPSPATYLIESLKASCLNAELRDLSPILCELRMIKSTAEIQLMRHAGHLTALAITEAMRCTAPGLMESQLGAVADYIFRVNGARGGGYPPIIAGGQNAWHGHYFRNSSELKSGELVLMDYAPDDGYYTSDIGRMWPVNGVYSAWQRELYGFIVEYHKALLKRIQPGILASEVMDEAAAEMQRVIDRSTFSKPYYESAARGALEFRGHLSHCVGMDVHDPGNYRNAPLIPGLVFAVDPMIWVPEEQLYIRVEDTVVITEAGIENLTQLAPLELDDVEETMKAEGMIGRLGELIVGQAFGVTRSRPVPDEHPASGTA